MSKISKVVKEEKERRVHRKDETVVNFMGGESFKINPVDTMKMVTASSIFGEPSYYRNGQIGNKVRDALYRKHRAVTGFTVLDDEYAGKTTTQIMEQVIDEALSYNFHETLKWAATLRNEYYMRLNPQVIMVRAAMHPDRKKFTEEFPGEFGRIEEQVMARADEPTTQIAYYLYLNKNKKNMPNILKKYIGKIYSVSEFIVKIKPPITINKVIQTNSGLSDVIRKNRHSIVPCKLICVTEGDIR